MKSPLRIRVEVSRQEQEQAILQLERASVRLQKARWELDEALDSLEKGGSKDA